MSLLSDAVEPSNLRLVFRLRSFLRDLEEDLREDLSFARTVAAGLRPGAPFADPDAVVRDLFPPFRPRPVPALEGKRIGLVASGGSGALASLCGVRRALEEAGVEVAAISACSGSTLFCALWACGLDAEEMARFWLSLRNEDYVDPDWRRLAGAGLRRLRGFGGLLRGAAVERSFRRRLGRVRLGDTPIPLYAVVWNVDENRVEYLGSATTPGLSVAAAARVAISIPIFVEPVKLRGRSYADGGIVNIFPVRPLVDHAEPLDLVLGVNCYYPRDFAGESIRGWEQRPWAVLEASGQLRSCVHLELAREQMRLLGSRLVLMHPVPYEQVRGARFYESFLDRKLWPEFMRLGYRSARETLQRLAVAREIPAEASAVRPRKPPRAASARP